MRREDNRQYAGRDVANAMKHLETAHPEMAAQVKATPKDDPMMVEWNKKFMP